MDRNLIGDMWLSDDWRPHVEDDIRKGKFEIMKPYAMAPLPQNENVSICSLCGRECEDYETYTVKWSLNEESETVCADCLAEELHPLDSGLIEM